MREFELASGFGFALVCDEGRVLNACCGNLIKNRLYVAVFGTGIRAKIGKVTYSDGYGTRHC